MATVALLNLSSQWGRLIVAIDQLKLNEISVDDYIQSAKSLLSRIIEECFLFTLLLSSPSSGFNKDSKETIKSLSEASLMIKMFIIFVNLRECVPI